MKPSLIPDILELARRARKNNRTFNPLFVGPPGLGKSEIVQAWCKKNNLPFIDIRAALLEAPDVVGFPIVQVVNGRQVTTYATPEEWPNDGEGVVFLDEINRGTTSVMNAFMQILTDRKIKKYDLPPGWIVVSCINPEDAHHDVNTMDTALKDRFEIFEVEYDKESFVDFMKQDKWDPTIVMFVESNTWRYSRPQDIGDVAGAKYISPRTLSKLNNALQSELPQNIELDVFDSILGKNVGKTFLSFKYDEQPVVLKDLLERKSYAFKKIKEFSNPENYKNGHISITIRDIVENDSEKVTDELLIDLLLVLPADQGPMLIREMEYKRKDANLLQRLVKKNDKIAEYFRAILKG